MNSSAGTVPAAPPAEPVAATTHHRLLTPPPTGGGSPIAIFHLESDSPADLDALLAGQSLAAPPGRPALRSLLGIDEGLVFRESPTAAQLMPHGGAAILSALSAALTRAGCPPAPVPAKSRLLYPEASDLIDACALDAIARAPSPLAIDVILRQRARWREPGAVRRAEEASAHTRPLHHLLTPPAVLLLGRPNIGKSALTNAMAGRAVSVVADEPGTTRDHVGVMINLAGLIVRWIDAPGLSDRPTSHLDRAAIQLARALIPTADLILLCHDCADSLALSIPATAARTLDVGLRADLAPNQATPTASLSTSARTGRGIAELAMSARRALLPDDLLACAEPWRFHPELPT